MHIFSNTLVHPTCKQSYFLKSPQGFKNNKIIRLMTGYLPKKLQVNTVVSRYNTTNIEEETDSHTPQFKAAVVLKSLSTTESTQSIVKTYCVSSKEVSEWRRIAIENMHKLFEKQSPNTPSQETTNKIESTPSK